MSAPQIRVQRSTLDPETRRTVRHEPRIMLDTFTPSGRVRSEQITTAETVRLIQQASLALRDVLPER